MALDIVCDYDAGAVGTAALSKKFAISAINFIPQKYFQVGPGRGGGGSIFSVRFVQCEFIKLCVCTHFFVR